MTTTTKQAVQVVRIINTHHVQYGKEGTVLSRFHDDGWDTEPGTEYVAVKFGSEMTPSIFDIREVLFITDPVFQMFISIDVTRQDVEDIFVTALEGGCNYWIARIDESKGARDTERAAIPRSVYFAQRLLEGAKLMFVLKVEGRIQDQRKTMTLDTFHAGLKRWYYLRSTQRNGSPRLERRSDDPIDLGLDVGNIDATEADVIFQMALFGDVVFG